LACGLRQAVLCKPGSCVPSMSTCASAQASATIQCTNGRGTRRVCGEVVARRAPGYPALVSMVAASYTSAGDGGSLSASSLTAAQPPSNGILPRDQPTSTSGTTVPQAPSTSDGVIEFRRHRGAV